MSCPDRDAYSLKYHLVFVTKGLRPVLAGDVAEFVTGKLGEACRQYGWGLTALEVMPQFVHVVVAAPPQIAPLTISGALKSAITLGVFRQFPDLKRGLLQGISLFSDRCYFGTEGAVSADTVRAFVAGVEEQ